jgi:flavin-dependent thymidylate synthase
MKVILAGYNIDTTLIEDRSEFIGYPYGREVLTPETIAAAYARISRDPKSVDELRIQAIKDVDKARKSCEEIVYGFGHSTVAEHAVFNFDIIDVSRLCVENIQHSRLASFTEKSQRYQKLTNDFYVPAELDDADKKKFVEYNTKQMEYYTNIYNKIKSHLLGLEEGITKDKKKLIINKTKEDARYVTTLAMYAQMGMTVNARTLESMITRLKSSYVEEDQILGQMLLDKASEIAPSLVKYRGPVKKVEYNIPGKPGFSFMQKNIGNKQRVGLSYYTEHADNILIGSIIFNNSDLTYDSAMIEAANMSIHEKLNMVRQFVESINQHSPMSREFEMIDFTFEVTLSATAFAQLKRHRVATIIKQPYSTGLFPSCPQTISDSGAMDDFFEALDNSSNMYDKLGNKYGPLIGDYALCQAHNRVVLFKMNARELYHFSRLRCDCHAQWEIREIANEIVEQAKEVAPLTCVAACGKDMFDEMKNNLMEKNNEDRKK